MTLDLGGREAEVLGRVLERFDQTDGGHWIWNSYVNTGGNPVLMIGKGDGQKGVKTLQVRRIVFEMLNRELQPDELVWRTCREQLCVASAHLKAMTLVEYYDQLRSTK
ncbi:hypothetical protein [Kribbella solani]|uniref:Uncharacterized protein n=1 Tax=Kribbella solani TaxID=236067 RepID=A0A841DV08_9ACTN|nr:hypothetical protein [Kribbella solani]MBB5982433.1 hypothetical protein [Kribbella solani]